MGGRVKLFFIRKNLSTKTDEVRRRNFKSPRELIPDAGVCSHALIDSARAPINARRARAPKFLPSPSCLAGQSARKHSSIERRRGASFRETLMGILIVAIDRRERIV